VNRYNGLYWRKQSVLLCPSVRIQEKKVYTRRCPLFTWPHPSTYEYKRNITGAMYIDLWKAFDTVNHSYLLSKLSYYGIYSTELKWTSDYLFNRKQFVSFNSVQSEPESIILGVPQGSILGPLLFVILVNDAFQCLDKCTMMMYADDTVLLYSDSSCKSWASSTE